MPFRPMAVVRQHFPALRLADYRAEVRAQMESCGMERGLTPGARVAIGVGSRGIAKIAGIVGEVVGWWKARGFAPFLFPAMGSHGSASAEGQAEVLAKYGITAETMGCEVRSSLEVVELGHTPEGIRVVMDKMAHQADGVMLVARVKWHTDFAGRLESGLFKMMAIGLGKLEGAQVYHAHAYRLGLEAVIRSVGRQVLASGRILGGLAILEDANHETAHVEAVGVAAMERREEELLEKVKAWMPRIPVEALDVLIVNYLGKNISGAGMDPKMINRSVHGAYNPWPFAPKIERIYLRDLHPLSYGNAVGLGMADVVHRRVVEKMRPEATYVNGITSGTMASIRIPAHFGSDRECLERTWRTAGRLEPSELRIGWIRDSQDLSVMAFSETLLEELRDQAAVEVWHAPRPVPFTADGELEEWLA